VEKTVSGWSYRHLIRPVLFKLDPETMHHAAIRMAKMAGYPPLNWLTRLVFAPSIAKPVELFGLTFPNCVGLAAGFDKDGTAWRGLANLGFGHIEIGTVTPLPQPGNPQPRIFRLPDHDAIINRMGFPGVGADAVLESLPKPEAKRTFILGINIGKNKDTPLENAVGDYTQLIQKFAGVADYLAVNLSSPNTPGLRELQGRALLDELIREILAVRNQEAIRWNRRLPLLVKLSPDLSDTGLDDALTVLMDGEVDGIIATNTTIDRQGVAQSSQARETGGLSGQPLRARSTEFIRTMVQRTGDRLPIIGVGGIDSVESAQEKLDAGAKLIQVYTGLIYQGPGLVKQLVNGIDFKTKFQRSQLGFLSGPRHNRKPI